MGLDTVELMMEVEDRFGVDLPDAEAERIITVADLYAYLLRKLRENKVLKSTCPSRSAFYRLRRALMRTSEIPRQTVQRRTKLNELLPRRKRRQMWERLAESLNVPLPPLHRPLHLGRCLFGVLLLVFIGGTLTCAAGALLVSGTEASDWFLLWSGSVVVMGLGATAVFMMTQPLAVCIPARCGTIEATVEYVVEIQKKRSAHASPAELWLTLREIISKQSGVKAEEIHPETRFIEVVLTRARSHRKRE